MRRKQRRSYKTRQQRNEEDTGRMKKSLLLVALTGLTILVIAGLSHAQAGPAPGGGLLGGAVGSRLQNLRNRMTNKDPSIQYNPSVLTPGTPRSQVMAAFGQPNGTQIVNGEQDDIYAFFPDGSKYVDPQITAGTIAAAVFTGGMSLAAKAAKNTIQQNQLTLYRVHYDSNQNIKSVKVIPPNIGSQPGAPPNAAPPPGAGY
jgi:hypothetical protein